MDVLLTCRECGYREMGRSTSPLMNRIKMWNHIARAHEERDIRPTQVRLVMREDRANRIEEEAYRLQASY